jgi:hypothetical protein
MTTPTPINQVYFRMFHTYYTDDVEHNNTCLTSPLNDANLNCRPKPLYNKVVTGGNDPTITANGQYSQMVNGSSYLRLTVQAAIAAGFLNPDGSANLNRNGNGNGNGNGNDNGSSTTGNTVACPVYK